jgi:predicted glycosyltransferase
VRVWVDLTNSPHVLVMRPIVEALRARGAEVDVTARDFAQTVGLAERFGLHAEVIGRHRGGRVAAKAVGLASRATALARWAGRRGRSRGRFDLALGHGSNDVTVAAALLRIPRSTMFDYEWAAVQHTVNCRLAQAVVVPEAIPPDRLDRYGARGKLQRYPGLKEEYYLADFAPDTAVLDELAIDAAQPIAVVRTPPEVSLYHRFEHSLFADVLDAQSLIAFSDLVVSAGGTMNREAVALGTPVWTTFEGRLGAVDEQLIADGRLRQLARAADLRLEKRPHTDAERVRRDPALLVDLLCAPLRPAATARR